MGKGLGGGITRVRSGERWWSGGDGDVNDGGRRGGGHHYDH